MRVVLWGLSHHTAPVALRERLALSDARQQALLARLRAGAPPAEVVLLSTCNRTEIYLARPAHASPTVDDILDLLATETGVDRATLQSASLHRENEDALRHLFRVASGLDSMVLGEAQVLGQVKRAYETATQAGCVGPVLHKSFQQALAIAKQLRHETGIDQGRFSVGSVAADLVRDVFDDFHDKTIVGIGAGEMAKLALTHLRTLNPGRLWLTNRTPQRALDLAQTLQLSAPTGGVRPWTDLEKLVVEADILVTSTAAPQPIITAAWFKPLCKRRRLRPLFIIDLAVPRDVEADVGSLTNVYLYNMDDLQTVVQRNQQDRQTVAHRCEPILRAAAAACLAEIQNRDIGQLVRALRQHLQQLGQTERERTLRKLQALPPEQLPHALDEALDEHTHRLINKILHEPLAQLDRRQTDTPLGFYATALRRLFGLTDPPAPGSASTNPFSAGPQGPGVPTPAPGSPPENNPTPEDSATASSESRTPPSDIRNPTSDILPSSGKSP